MFTPRPQVYVTNVRRSSPIWILVETMAELNIARRRRGVAISSITHLEKHVIELEGKEKLSHKDEVAMKGDIKRLENLDKDFKGLHCSVIDLVEEDEEVLLEEQGG